MSHHDSRTGDSRDDWAAPWEWTQARQRPLFNP